MYTLYPMTALRRTSSQARTNPNAFMSLVGHVLPLAVKDSKIDPTLPTVRVELHPEPHERAAD